MWDRIVNALYEFIRSLSNTTFIIIVAVLVTLGFLFVGNFLKANKKESSKVSKFSQLLWAVVMIVLLIILVNIRG